MPIPKIAQQRSAAAKSNYDAKIRILENLVKEAEKAITDQGRWEPSVVFPKSIAAFIAWDVEDLGIKRMSRDSIYGAKHKAKRTVQVQGLIDALVKYASLKSSRSADLERLRALLSEERKRVANLASQLQVLRDEYSRAALERDSANAVIQQRDQIIAHLRGQLSQRAKGGLSLIGGGDGKAE